MKEIMKSAKGKRKFKQKKCSLVASKKNHTAIRCGVKEETRKSKRNSVSPLRPLIYTERYINEFCGGREEGKKRKDVYDHLHGNELVTLVLEALSNED